MADFVDEDSLTRRFGPSRFIQLFDDDGDGVADPLAVTEVLEDANADLRSYLLRKGYTDADLDALVADPLLRRLAAAIAMGYAGERRTEWLNDKGEGRYHAVRERAYGRLQSLQKAETRVPTEGDAGVTNKRVRGKVSAADPPFVFASSANDKANGSSGPGGF